MLELLEAHAPLWEKMHQLLQKNRFPHSLLFVGPRHENITQFVNRLIAVLICENKSPCEQCRACHLLIQGIHPDIHYIRPEGTSSAIKVEQVRELQQNIYQTPQCGARRFIVIDPADKMNISAANALLKILEEPPSHTIFILIAEQLSSIPATILSRCQKYNFHSLGSVDNHAITHATPTCSGLSEASMDPAYKPRDVGVGYLMIGERYALGSSRAELFQQSAAIMTELCALIEEKSSPCTIAAKWSEYGFDDLLWLLYLLTAQAIHQQLIKAPKGAEPLMHFSRLTSPVTLLNQLEQINAIMRKINHNINMNQTLTLEHLLLGYIGK